jgi:hypothetical protein
MFPRLGNEFLSRDPIHTWPLLRSDTCDERVLNVVSAAQLVEQIRRRGRSRDDVLAKNRDPGTLGIGYLGSILTEPSSLASTGTWIRQNRPTVLSGH